MHCIHKTVNIHVDFDLTNFDSTESHLSSQTEHGPSPAITEI